MLKLGKLRIGKNGAVSPQNSSGDNNPTKGGTTYTIDRRGRIVNSVGCNGYSYDVVMVGSSSYRCEKSLSVDEYTYGHDQKGVQIEHGDYGLFKFLVDNTDVEWGTMYNGGLNPSDSTECFLQTSHDNGECHVSFCWAEFDTFVHSHPKDGIQRASDSDENMKEEMLRDDQNRVSNFGVYLKGDKSVKRF